MDSGGAGRSGRRTATLGYVDPESTRRSTSASGDRRDPCLRGHRDGVADQHRGRHPAPVLEAAAAQCHLLLRRLPRRRGRGPHRPDACWPAPSRSTRARIGHEVRPSSCSSSALPSSSWRSGSSAIGRDPMTNHRFRVDGRDRRLRSRAVVGRRVRASERATRRTSRSPSAAAVAISTTGLPGAQQAVVIAVYVVLACLGVAAPIVTVLALGDRSTGSSRAGARG